MDLHSNHNSETDVAVGCMCLSYNCYQETAHRQAYFPIDNQNCNVNHHSTHNSKTAEYHGVVTDGINQSCHGRNRDLGYRQTRFLTLSCHNWGNCHHYKNYHTTGKPEGVDET